MSIGSAFALILVGASLTQGLVLFSFARARRRMPISWFSLSFLMMSIYSLAMVATTLPQLPEWVLLSTGPIGYATAATFIFATNRFLTHQMKREETRFDRALAILLLSVAAVSLLPGVAFAPNRLRVWSSMWTIYQLPYTTEIAWACCAVLLLGLLNLLRLLHMHGSKSMMIAGIGLCAAGICDMSISHSLMDWPFLAGFACLTFLIAASLNESGKWGDEASLLSELKASLEARVRERSDELAETHRKLAQSERLAALGRLAASVGHEINNPLTYVSTNLQLLSHRVNEEEKEMAEDALEGIDRIAKIVADLRVFSIPDEPSIDVVDLDLVLQISAKTLAHRQTNRIKIELQCCGNAFVLGNEGRLTQLFLNLLSNAIDASPKDGKDYRVFAESSLEDSDLVVRVKDQGVGIPKSILPRLFEPFSTARAGGTGLGLAIARTIAEESDGSITVESNENTGTVFSVRLPRADADTKHFEQFADDVPDTNNELSFNAFNKAQKKILVVDDEPLVLRSLSLLLAEHSVSTATNGAMAIEMLKNNEFDLVLCDLMMPGLNGFDVLEQLAELNPMMTNRFILMSGGIPNPEMERRLQSGGSQILHKPFQRAELLEIVS